MIQPEIERDVFALPVGAVGKRRVEKILPGRKTGRIGLGIVGLGKSAGAKLFIDKAPEISNIGFGDEKTGKSS